MCLKSIFFNFKAAIKGKATAQLKKITGLSYLDREKLAQIVSEGVSEVLLINY